MDPSWVEWGNRLLVLCLGLGIMGFLLELRESPSRRPPRRDADAFGVSKDGREVRELFAQDAEVLVERCADSDIATLEVVDDSGETVAYEGRYRIYVRPERSAHPRGAGRPQLRDH